MSLSFKIRAFGVLRSYIPSPEGVLRAELETPKPLSEILKPYNIPHGLIMMVSIGGVPKDLSYQPRDGDEISLVPPISGGGEITNPTAHEGEGEKRLTTWPHLLSVELIATMAVLVVLLLISLLAEAPLSGPADESVTPNPIKAPWCFVGIQELLVYFDPWLGGTVLPIFIVFALITLPYLDYPSEETRKLRRRRRFAITSFSILLLAWFGLIIVGSLFRGPGWRMMLPPNDVQALEPPATTPETGEKPPARTIIDISVGKPLAGRQIQAMLALRLREEGLVPFLGGILAALLSLVGIPLALALLFRRRFRLDTAGAVVRASFLAFYTWVMVGVLVKILLYHIIGLNYFVVTSWFNI